MLLVLAACPLRALGPIHEHSSHSNDQMIRLVCRTNTVPARPAICIGSSKVIAKLLMQDDIQQTSILLQPESSG